MAQVDVSGLRDEVKDVRCRRPAGPDALIKQWARMVRCRLSSQEENR